MFRGNSGRGAGAGFRVARGNGGTPLTGRSTFGIALRLTDYDTTELAVVQELAGRVAPDCEEALLVRACSHDYKVFLLLAQGAVLHGKGGQSWHSRSAGRGESLGWQPESSKPTQQEGGCCGWFGTRPVGDGPVAVASLTSPHFGA